MVNIDGDFKNQIFNIQLSIYLAKSAKIIPFAYGGYKIWLVLAASKKDATSKPSAKKET